MSQIFINEVVVLCVILCIAFYEFIGILLARIKGLTKNISRIITHLTLSLITLYLLIYLYKWYLYFQKIDIYKWEKVEFVNWQLLIVIIVIGFLIVYEFVGIYYARKFKLTKNISRLVTHLIMLILFIVLLYLNIFKWNIYIERLKEPSLPWQKKFSILPKK